jgi:hypothetical protein
MQNVYFLIINFVTCAPPLITAVVNKTKIYSLAMFEFRCQYISIRNDAAFYATSYSKEFVSFKRYAKLKTSTHRYSKTIM